MLYSKMFFVYIVLSCIIALFVWISVLRKIFFCQTLFRNSLVFLSLVAFKYEQQLVLQMYNETNWKVKMQNKNRLREVALRHSFPLWYISAPQGDKALYFLKSSLIPIPCYFCYFKFSKLALEIEIANLILLYGENERFNDIAKIVVDTYAIKSVCVATLIIMKNFSTTAKFWFNVKKLSGKAIYL